MEDYNYKENARQLLMHANKSRFMVTSQLNLQLEMTPSKTGKTLSKLLSP
jgi:hypothetical protein